MQKPCQSIEYTKLPENIFCIIRSGKVEYYFIS